MKTLELVTISCAAEKMGCERSVIETIVSQGRLQVYECGFLQGVNLVELRPLLAVQMGGKQEE